MSDVANALVLATLATVQHEKRDLLPPAYPNDEVIGRYFISGCGAIYYCDSYDPNQGYWMTPAREGDTSWCRQPATRTNVSERAIGGTFHRIYRDEDSAGVWYHTALINASIKGFTFESEPHREYA